MYPTLIANLLSELMMQGSVTFVSEDGFAGNVPGTVHGATVSLPCHIFMVNLRTMHRSASPDPDTMRGLLLHNKAYDCQFAIPDYCVSTESKVS